jgi:ABC-type polysaccharide/polyol phosphate transport system ATPase subunit
MIPAVAVRHVTKKFKLQHEKYSTLRELFLSSLLFWRRRQFESLTALDNISFEVPKGQSLGIVGDNGSGKSTLLKLILGITPPTSGEIKVQGKISALLELGAGFHPDLTGRENIYLNGSILGIPKQTIEEKMDEIIDFAELRQFIDTPIRHYSSGMYVRLGFSIAIHTDPEILLVDEVLAVGDSAFQQKCMDKVRQFQADGKTIILVSHDLGMIEKVCDRAILLKRGLIERDDSALNTVKTYYERIIQQRKEFAEKYGETQIIPTQKRGYRQGSGEIKITQVRILDKNNQECYMFKTGDTMNLEINYETDREIDNPIFGIGIATEEMTILHSTDTQMKRESLGKVTGKGMWRVSYPHLNLMPGKYVFGIGIYRNPISESTAYDYHACLHSIYISSDELKANGPAYLPETWEFKQT